MEVSIRVRQQIPEDHVIMKVAAEDGRDERHRTAQPKRLNNVFLNVLGSCCRQRQTGNSWYASPQLTQFEVVWPKIVAPLGDAVSLVHSQVGQQAAGTQARQAGLERGRGHHLWSDVEKLQFGPLAPQISQDQTALAHRKLGVDGAGSDVELLQVIHLVLENIMQFK